MRYVLLFHIDAASLDALPLAERQDVDRQTMAADDELRQAGQLIHAQAIQGAHSARLVRVRDGKISATDGPFVETKEQMGGFVLIEARDLNEAIAIAGRDPLAEFGTVEIRPIHKIPIPS